MASLLHGESVQEVSQVSGKMLTPGEFSEKLFASVLIVAEARMGSVISAMEAGNPIVVVPRRAAPPGEVTKGHQMHIVIGLKEKPRVFVASTESELAFNIGVELDTQVAAPEPLKYLPAPEFVARIRSFLVAS